MVADATGEAELGALRMQLDRSVKAEFAALRLFRTADCCCIGNLTTHLV